VNFSWIGKSWKAVENTAVARPDLPASLNAALADLDRWTLPSPDWEPLRLRMAMIMRAAFANRGSPVPSLEPADDQTAFLLERIRQGWGEDVPAVRVVTPGFDRTSLLARFKALDDCADPDHLAGRRFHRLLASEPERIADWAGMMLIKGEQNLLPSLQQFDVEPNYAFSTLRLGLLGELGDWSNRVTAQLCESSWPHGECPVCGASPALAESRGLEQRRFLRCDRCGAGWPSDRLRCPFCGVNDHHALRTLFAEEDQERCRLVLCDGCGGRLKVITSLAPLSHPGLVLAQFTMFYLDFIDDASIRR
jgi:Protein involved in formate dehydrogenase formation